ncbi:MAG: hypothetical protein KAS66_13240 [Candidatus Omnitrophica bacterium]|nr:hypothetical protein [Candidatus Omnitrophota bacterium]
MKKKKTFVVCKVYLLCRECGSFIYVCDDCKEYFKHGEIVYCHNCIDFDDARHVCEACFEKS